MTISAVPGSKAVILPISTIWVIIVAAISVRIIPVIKTMVGITVIIDVPITGSMMIFITVPFTVPFTIPFTVPFTVTSIMGYMGMGYIVMGCWGMISGLLIIIHRRWFVRFVGFGFDIRLDIRLYVRLGRMCRDSLHRNMFRVG